MTEQTSTEYSTIESLTIKPTECPKCGTVTKTVCEQVNCPLGLNGKKPSVVLHGIRLA